MHLNLELRTDSLPPGDSERGGPLSCHTCSEPGPRLLRPHPKHRPGPRPPPPPPLVTSNDRQVYWGLILTKSTRECFRNEKVNLFQYIYHAI